MNVNRRQFVILSAAIAAGCKPASDEPPASEPSTEPASSQPSDRAVDAGPLGDFPRNGVYDSFRARGFFVIRRDRKLLVLSATCTHKGCKVRVSPDQSFYCKCHGSRFDRDGRVTRGPATRDLPKLQVRTDERNHLLVKLAGAGE